MSAFAEAPEVAKAEVDRAAYLGTADEKKMGRGSLGSADITQYGSEEELNPDFPSEEERATLRRVSGPIPWIAFTIAFVELCERFSYYGTTIVCKLLFHRWLLRLLMNI